VRLTPLIPLGNWSHRSPHRSTCLNFGPSISQSSETFDILYWGLLIKVHSVTPIGHCSIAHMHMLIYLVLLSRAQLTFILSQMRGSEILSTGSRQLWVFDYLNASHRRTSTQFAIHIPHQHLSSLLLCLLKIPHPRSPPKRALRLMCQGGAVYRIAQPGVPNTLVVPIISVPDPTVDIGYSAMRDPLLKNRWCKYWLIMQRASLIHRAVTRTMPVMTKISLESQAIAQCKIRVKYYSNYSQFLSCK